MSDKNIKNSQNFLYNSALVDELIKKTSICEDDIVYEIGTGKGIITKSLACFCKKVVSIELDTRLVESAKKKIGTSSNVEIIYGDFLRVSIPSNPPYKIFSNIPFNITSEIMSKVLNLDGVKDIYLIMQYEAFLKYAGAPYYEECYKSLLYKPFFQMKLLHELSANDFKPIPKVRIVFVHIEPKDKPDVKKEMKREYADFISYLFMESGANIKEKTKRIFSYEQIKRISKRINFSIEESPAKLKFFQWVMLFDDYMRFVSNEKKQRVCGSYAKLLKKQSQLEKRKRGKRTKR